MCLHSATDIHTAKTTTATAPPADGIEGQSWFDRKSTGVEVSPTIRERIQRLNTDRRHILTAWRTTNAPTLAAPTIAKYFEPFQKKVDVRWDDQFRYVESNGLPDHEMMTGITAWQ